MPRKTLKQVQVNGTPRTNDYRAIGETYFNRPRDLPALSYEMIQAMLLDPELCLGLAMRAAPLASAEFAYQDSAGNWIPGVEAESREIGDYVWRQMKRIWQFLEELTSAQIWGWSAGEIMLKSDNGRVEIDYLLGRHAMDTRALLRGGVLVGTRVLRGSKSGNVDLFFDECKTWFTTFRPESGSHYGRTILKGAYSPWADKWLNGAALDVRRLFMHKDSYGGVDLAYPEGVTTMGTTEVPNRDIANQIVEQLQAGGVTTRPSSYDSQGNQKWVLTRATVPANPTHILQYPKDLDTEMYHGLEIPDDVLQADGTGAWAGKRIPLAAFYAGLDSWLHRLVRDLRTQVIDSLVELNFGRKAKYEIRTKPLALQAMEQQANAGPGGQSGQAGVQEKTALSLDAELAVGEGVLSASELVEAARQSIALRMNVTDKEGHEHGADGKFTSHGAGGATKKSVPVSFVPPRQKLDKPIVGPSGAKIVGYDWKHHYEFRVRRGEEVEVPVSDWSQKGKSEGTGRDIVHHFFVEHPDGKVTLEGMNSAQKILGISLPKLRTVAKNEAAARELRLKQEKRMSQQYEDVAAASPNEAHRDYWQRNKMSTRSQDMQDQLLKDTVTLKKNGKYIKVPSSTGEMLKEHGWESNEPVKNTDRDAE